MRQIPLKQHNVGRKGGEPDAIVIHWSAGSGDEVKLGEYFKRNPQREASYHRGIGRAGGVAEYVDTANTAWHAGDGEAWDGQPGRPGRRINDRSVGICLTLLGPASRAWAKLHPERTLTATHRKRAVRSTTWERPTPEQIASLREQVAELKAKHPGILWLVGHDDVTKGKQDPGPILDGVDLGLEALGLRWLRRRWDLPGAPWDDHGRVPTPTQATPAPAPQEPAREPEDAGPADPAGDELPDLPEALPDPPAEERIERPAGALGAIAHALGEAAARGANLIRLAQADDELPDLPAPLGDAGDAGERPAPAPVTAPVTAPQTPADAAARAQGREPSKGAAERAAREVAKAAEAARSAPVAAPAPDSAPTAHAVPEDQEGEPGAVS